MPKYAKGNFKRKWGPKKKTKYDKKQDKIIRSLQPEMKYFLAARGFADAATAPEWTAISSIPSGNTNITRIGTKIHLHQIHCNVIAYQNGAGSDTAPYLYRCWIVAVKHEPGAANPPITAPSFIANTNSIPLGFLNTGAAVQGGKYIKGSKNNVVHVLYDSGPMFVTPWSGTATGYSSKDSYRLIKKKLNVNKIITYPSSNTTEPFTNALYFVHVAGSNQIETAMESMIVYTDC